MKTFDQFLKKFDEDMAMTTSAVPGAGDDNQTVIVRKKYDRKIKRAENYTLLKRLIKNRKK